VRSAASLCLGLCCLFASPSVALASPVVQEKKESDNDKSLLSEQVDLARLLDLCSNRLKLDLEYDPAVVKGSLTFRFNAGVTDDELWSLTNRLLATHGFTTVQTSAARTLSVVKLAEAAGLARIEDGDPKDALGGFLRVVRTVKNRPAKELVSSLQLVLSKPGGSVSPAEGADLVVIADLKPQLLRALNLLEVLDAPRGANTIREYEAKHLPATELATLVDRVLATQTGLDPGSTPGKVLATPDEKRVLVIALPSQADRMLELLARFDQRESQTTVTFTPKSFAVRDVARLIDQVLSGTVVGQNASHFKVVEDDLTGTLLLTATASQHAQVKALVERLDATATASRRPIRSFKLKNRPVTEILSLLESLIAAGAIESGTPTPMETASTSSGTPKTEPEAPKVVHLPPPPAQSDSRNDHGTQQQPSSKGGGTKTAAQAVTTPEVSLSADEGTNTLVAVGESRILDQIEKLLNDLDIRQPQVMLEALVLSLTESDAKSLGVELEKLGIANDVRFRLASLFGLGTPDASGAALPSPTGTGFHGVVLDPGSFSAIVRALESIDRGRTLTIPRVLVDNNQQGRLDSVLQTPYQSTNASTTVATTSFGGTVDAGTTITMRPQIAEGDHLLLEYDVSVSSFVGDSTNASLPPPRQQNKIASSVTIPDGYTVVVGGLAIHSQTQSTSQIPWLGDIPLLGRLFQNRSDTTRDSKLFVFLHADVMRGTTFEKLRYLSDRAKDEGSLDDGTPRVQPRFVK
jgi:general secretion pathway protein D